MAQVSGIEVKFTGDTRDLEKSVGRAQSVISGFAKSAIKGLAGALSVGAFVAAGKAALNFADDIGKMAQKVGMSTEALSKLTYAANLSDVSMQELQVGVQQLAKNMEAGSKGMAALGISATDSAGNLRSTAEVFADVAEAFANMEDGAGKTAIAMNIFGRSGAQLIPLLNSGRSGLKEMGDEAKRLGVVISDDAAKAAERFNDNLTRLQTAIEGLTQQALAPLLPYMIRTTEALLSVSSAGQSASDSMQRLSNWFETLHPSFANFAKEGEMVLGVLERMGVISGSASPKSDLQGVLSGGGVTASSGDLAAMLGSAGGTGKSKAPSLGGGGGESSGGSSRVPGIAGVDEIDSFFIERLAAIQDNFKTEQEVLAEQYASDQEVLRGAMDNKLLSEQEYMAASQKLAQDHAKALSEIQSIGLQENLGLASDFFGSMQQIAEQGGKKATKIAKVFGIAQALISTFQGAAKALTLPFPANLAAYAATLAQGMSAVAAIKGVSESGGNSGGGGGGGGGGRGGRGGAAVGGGNGAQSPTTTFQFTLMNDPMGFGEKFARQFIDQLNSTQRNGGQIRGVIA